MKNPQTFLVPSGKLTCEVFPRKRGYEVLCALSRPGKEPVFASHGIWPSKEAAWETVQEVAEALKENPTRYINWILHRRNPSSLYESFHGNPPARVRRVSVNMPKRLVKIGRLLEVVYRPEAPSRRKGTAYRHEFGDDGRIVLPSNSILATNQSGTELYIIRDKPSKYPHFSSRGVIG